MGMLDDILKHKMDFPCHGGGYLWLQVFGSPLLGLVQSCTDRGKGGNIGPEVLDEG